MNWLLRSFQPVAALVTLIITLLGLTGCVDPTTNPIKDATPEIANPVAVNDTATSDTGIDAATQALMYQSQRYNMWIQTMDPYMIENSDWTYSFNESGFRTSIESMYPDVYNHYVNAGPATDDTVVIDTLVDNLSIGNPYILEQYQVYQETGAVPPPSIYGSWQWYGYKRSYTGSDATVMLGKMQVGAGAITISGIGTVIGGVLELYTGVAAMYTGWYGGFGIRIYWNLGIGIDAP